MAEESQCSMGNDTNPLKRKYDNEQGVKLVDFLLLTHPADSITSKLKHLVCEKHLSTEDALLLSDFLSSHPEGCLRDDKTLSSKTKGFAYTRLADLLRLLNDHTKLEILGSLRSSFSELLHDLRYLSFVGPWLDSLEQDNIASSHLDFSLESLQKLIDSEDLLTREVQSLRVKVNSLSQGLDKLKRRLEGSEAELVQIREQKEAVLEARASSNVPFTF